MLDIINGVLKVSSIDIKQAVMTPEERSEYVVRTFPVITTYYTPITRDIKDINGQRLKGSCN